MLTDEKMKDLVIQGLSHPQLLEPAQVQQLCEKLATILFDETQLAAIVKVLNYVLGDTRRA